MLLFLLAAMLPLCISGQLATPEEDAALLFAAVDTNDDQLVEIEEIVIYFDQMDTDHDGAVSRPEFAAYWQGRYPDLTVQAIHNLFDALDFDGDHHLVRADFTNLYGAMDTDDDGIVTEQEFLPFWIAKEAHHYFGFVTSYLLQTAVTTVLYWITMRFYEFQTHPGK